MTPPQGSAGRVEHHLPPAHDAQSAQAIRSRPGLGARHSVGIPTLWVAPAALFLIGFFLLPLIQNGVRSFFPHGIDGGFDLANYAKLFTDPYYLGVLGQTLLLSLMVAAISAVIGYPIAWFMVRQAGRWQSLVIFMLIAPLLTSIIMRTFGWRVLLARFGIVNIVLRSTGLVTSPIDFLRWPGVAVTALIHVLVPFMVLAIAASLQSIDRRLEESARLLGAGRVRHLHPHHVAAHAGRRRHRLHPRLHAGQRQLRYPAVARRRLADPAAADLPTVQCDAGLFVRQRDEHGAADRRGRVHVRATPADPPPGRPRDMRGSAAEQLAQAGLIAFTAGFFVFLMAPILIVVLVSFSSLGYIAFPIPGYTLKWFRRVWEYAPFLDGLWVSMKLAVSFDGAGRDAGRAGGAGTRPRP